MEINKDKSMDGQIDKDGYEGSCQSSHLNSKIENLVISEYQRLIASALSDSLLASGGGSTPLRSSKLLNV